MPTILQPTPQKDPQSEELLQSSSPSKSQTHSKSKAFLHTDDNQTRFLKIKGLPKSVKVVEVLNNETGSLYRDVESLKSFGYDSVYHRKGQIFVKRTPESDPILITCSEDVRELKRRKDCV